MAIKTLRPKTYTVVPTRVPWNRIFTFWVEAEHPVDTFLLDDEELAKYRKGKEVTSFGGSDERRLHRERGRLPYGGEWFLVISNPSEDPVAVYYEVSNPV